MAGFWTFRFGRVRRIWRIQASCLSMVRPATVVAFVAFVVMAALPGESGAVKPSLVDPVARIDYGQASGQAALILKLDGLDAAGLADPSLLGKVTDLVALATGPTVKPAILAKEITTTGASSRMWLLTVDASSMVPGTGQTRWLNVQFGGTQKDKSEVLAYTLTNAAVATFAWTVRGVPTLTIEPGDPLPVSITVGPVQATNVKAIQSTFAEKIFKTALADKGLILCKSAEANECATPEQIDLPPNSATQLFLHGTAGAGVFEGTVTISALEKREGDAVAMTANVSSVERKAWGVVLIFVSAAATMWLTVWLRNKQNRAQLLLPVAETLGQLERMGSLYNPGAAVIPALSIASRLLTTAAELTDDRLLRNGMPSRIPLAGGATAPESVENFRKYVQLAADWTQALQILIQEGLVAAWKHHESGDQSAQEKARVAVAAIDKLIEVSAPPGAEALRASLRPILEAMNGPNENSKSISAVANRLGQHNASVPTSEQLRVEIASVSLFNWAFLLLTTTLSGAFIMVVAGPTALGFGTPSDYFYCLLWGLGLPTGAQALTSTTGSVAAVFGISKPVA